jgi:hypothetical protein
MFLTPKAFFRVAVLFLLTTTANAQIGGPSCLSDMRYDALLTQANNVFASYKAQLDTVLTCQKQQKFWDGSTCSAAEIPPSCPVNSINVLDENGRLRCMVAVKINLDNLMAQRGLPVHWRGPNIHDSQVSGPNAERMGAKFCKELGYPIFRQFFLGSKRGGAKAMMYSFIDYPSNIAHDPSDIIAGDPRCNGCGARVAEIECAIYGNN